MRDYLRRLISPYYDLEVVADGEAALAAIARRKPDLVLTDIMLPRIDGLELLTRLRADPATSTIRNALLLRRIHANALSQRSNEHFFITQIVPIDGSCD
jgi:CheY-like chemotaxis protein